jgi:hypothetical protein
LRQPVYKKFVFLCFVSALSNNQCRFARAATALLSRRLPDLSFFKHVGCILSAFGLALDLLVCGSDTSSLTTSGIKQYPRYQRE